MDKRDYVMYMINEMIGADPHAMTELFNFRVPCNDKLKNLSGIKTIPMKDELGRTKYTIGLMGMINAVLHSMHQEKIAVRGKANENKTGLILVEHCHPYELLFPEKQKENDK